MTQPSGTTFLSEKVFRLDGEPYQLLTDDGASKIGGPGARAWTSTPIDEQEVGPNQQFTIPLVDFSEGGGWSYEGMDSVYDYADGWDATNLGVLTTWGQLAQAESFNSHYDTHGWVKQFGAYVYVFRGRAIVKYLVDPTKGSVWSIVEKHLIDSANATYVVAGRPERFNGHLYVPVVDYTGPTLKKFLQLTTQVTTIVEQQTITITGTPTGGSYVLHWQGEDTANIPYNSIASAVQAALRLLPGLEKVTVGSTGSTPNFVHTVTFTGAAPVNGSASPAQMTVTDNTTGGTHNIAIATTVAGTGDTWTQGPAGREFLCFRNWQNKLVAADLAALIYTVAGDPMVDGNWAPSDGNGYAVGNPGYRITDMCPWDGDIFVGKENGLFSFNENLLVRNEMPDIEAIVDSQNFVGAEPAGGMMLAPHRSGLIEWGRSGYHMTFDYTGPEQEGQQDANVSKGWGRVANIAPSGRATYYTVNDAANGRGALCSLQPPDKRVPHLPHIHHIVNGSLEGLVIASVQHQPVNPQFPDVWANDSAVGTIDWLNPGNAGADDGTHATAAAGTSHYLKGELSSSNIPASATILGILVEVKRSVTV